MTEQLLPCPFCGSADLEKSNNGDNHWNVWCNGCATSGPDAVGEDDAIVVWNRRSDTASKHEIHTVRDHALLDGECYRRALDVAIAAQLTELDQPWSESVCNLSDAIATERERRSK